jgi:hypothetical protein
MKTWPFSTTAPQDSPRVGTGSTTRAEDYSHDLNRMLSAAVVSRRFCNLLLTDAEAALHSGYNGESFELSERERTAILAIRAGTLRDFAAQLIDEVSDQDPSDFGHYTPSHTRRNETAPGVAHFA